MSYTVFRAHFNDKTEGNKEQQVHKAIVLDCFFGSTTVSNVIIKAITIICSTIMFLSYTQQKTTPY